MCVFQGDNELFVSPLPSFPGDCNDLLRVPAEEKNNELFAFDDCRSPKTIMH